MLFHLVRHTNIELWFSNILAQYGFKRNPLFTKHQLKPPCTLLTFPTTPFHWSWYSYQAIGEG